MVTGVPPVEFDLLFNAMFEPAGPAGKNYWHDSTSHVPALRDGAKDKELTATALFLPVSACTPVQYNISYIDSLGKWRLGNIRSLQHH